MEALLVRSVVEAVLINPLALSPHVCFTTEGTATPSDVAVAPVRTSHPVGSVTLAVPVPSASNVCVNPVSLWLRMRISVAYAKWARPQ